MRKVLALIFALVAWFALVAQFVLMLQNRTASVPETVVRFFSFFTILTNLIVALFYTAQLLNIAKSYKPGILSAVTVYIFIVGIVYQILLRHIWQPQGLQMVVDELLHTINPLLVILYWYLFEKKLLIRYLHTLAWMVYPIMYLIYILVRGEYSGFYPYPFVNVDEIGISKTLLNSALLTVLFLAASCILVKVGRMIEKKGLLTA